MKKICVYCSSSNIVDKSYFNTAKELGILMAQKEYALVYGAGSVGLMYEVAKNIHELNGHVIGVIPQRLRDYKVCYEGCDELIITDNMRQRKDKMDEISDAFITLPGGVGTLEEIMEMITGKQLGFHNKALVFINTNGFYDELLKFFDKMQHENFIKEQDKNLYFVANSPKEALDYIENYKAEELENKWAKSVKSKL